MPAIDRAGAPLEAGANRPEPRACGIKGRLSLGPGDAGGIAIVVFGESDLNWGRETTFDSGFGDFGAPLKPWRTARRKPGRRFGRIRGRIPARRPLQDRAARAREAPRAAHCLADRAPAPLGPGRAVAPAWGSANACRPIHLPNPEADSEPERTDP